MNNGANTSKLTNAITLCDSFKHSPPINTASERETPTYAYAISRKNNTFFSTN